MSDLVIRPLVSADVAQLQNLHAKLLPVTYPSSFFLHLLIRDSHSCVVALHCSEPVAWVSASFHRTNELLGSEPHIQLLTLGVLPRYRHRGLAKRLIGEVITLLHKDHSVPIPLVYTHVCTSNAPAQAFYEHIGMKPFVSKPTGALYVAKNMYSPHSAWHVTSESRNLFESRDAYILVGKVSA
ncbi:acyl-CoA N-acyltransferase [Rhodocollybia butyracea]|uniref:N-alpha-acetyltransferase 60 n=1 Tax=Rhodocollybia butyracea TaxID=206335 RepID=A0A9P5PZ63_9AGAR|nr:acyl-CoA N-acyltransferase [Rhodocollybia butyracea]